MTDIFLFRHGQAGTREDYDLLSELGRNQAARLGEYLAAQEIEFDLVVSGGMRRQKETAQIAVESMASRGRKTPDLAVDDRWNEFSLLSLYQGIVSRMVEGDPAFARDYAEMVEAIKEDPHTTRGATGRCDAAVILSWIENRYPEYEGEAWSGFSGRIRSIIPEIAEDPRVKTVGVFTSATPITVLTADALELNNQRLLSILGVVSNTSMTVLRYSGELRLFTFNAAPHLDARTRTYR